MEKIKAKLNGNIVSSNSSSAFSLLSSSNFGERLGEKVIYSIFEAFYLAEINKLNIFSGEKKLTRDEIERKFIRIDKSFNIKYPVFEALRKKGYIVKTALKLGADFRVYEKGADINKQHARWLAYCVSENQALKWDEFAAKSRIAHSTNKKLMICVVDAENTVSHYEVGWLRH